MLSIGFEYDETLDEYDIWHTNQELEFNNQDFKSYVGSKAQEYFFSNNIFNFSFGYDHHKFKELINIDKVYLTFQENNINLRVQIKPTTYSGVYINNYNLDMEINTISKINIKESCDDSIVKYESVSDSEIDLGNTIFRENGFEEVTAVVEYNNKS